MDTESNNHIIEIELNEGISSIDNLNEFVQQIIGSITRNISYYTNNNSSSFTNVDPHGSSNEIIFLNLISWASTTEEKNKKININLFHAMGLI